MAFEKLKKSVKKFAGRTLADEEAVNELVKDIQRALLQADADVGMVKELSEDIKQEALKKDIPSGMTRKEHVLTIVHEHLVEFLGAEEAEPPMRPQRILLVGLFGAGKTTTAAKLAAYYRKRGLKPGLIAADTFRPAAYDQLKQNAEKADVAFYGEPDTEDAAQVVRNGLEELDAEVIIVDSAGRDSMDDELREEIERIERAMQPDTTYLVVPADIGQAAREQAEHFNTAVGIDGVIVTKLDASAKGGGALASTAVTGAPVMFIGNGERLEDLEVYDPENFVADLLGEPNLENVLEKAEQAIDKEAAKNLMEGDFTMEDFFDQMEQMTGTGMMDQMLDKLPFGDKLPEDALDIQEEKLGQYRAIMNSMTPEERADPSIVDKSRADRIALGAGTERGDVRQMIKQFRQAKNMMDKFSGKNMKRGGIDKMLKQLGM